MSRDAYCAHSRPYGPSPCMRMRPEDAHAVVLLPLIKREDICIYSGTGDSWEEWGCGGGETGDWRGRMWWEWRQIHDWWIVHALG